MKYLTTKKALKANYYNIISVGYCDLQHLLQYENPISYCASRYYGWRCDNYEVDGVLISTGYSPIDGKGVKEDYKITKEFDNKALKIRNNNTISTVEMLERLKELLKEYVKVMINKQD